MGLDLALTILDVASGETFARRFEGPAVLLGRDAQMCDCTLPDGHVSKLHASVEIRGAQLFVRDASSTNGTFVGGKRIDSNSWTCLGEATRAHEIVISRWRVTVRAEETEPRSSPLSVNLASLATEVPRPTQAAMGTYAMHQPLDGLGSLYAQHMAMLARIHAELVRVLEAAPPSAREFIAREAIARFPLLLNNVDFHVLFGRYGAHLPLSADRAALLALQDLSRAHVDPQRPVATPREIALFAANLTTTLSTLFAGTMQLFAGMREFEHQMDLDADQSGAHEVPSSRRPTSPDKLARALLDWTQPTAPALDVLRRRFSALMMHHVAMLNGVMRGVKVLLTEFAPKTLEKMLARGEGKGGKLRRFFAWFSRPRALWSLFSERYGDLADEENERFRLLFGPEFATEYRQLAREASGGRRGAGASSVPPPPR
jgi:predicted component of type VI protein secretion system